MIIVKIAIYICIGLFAGIMDEKGTDKAYNNILCRTKITMKTNTESFERKYDTITFGAHRNIFYGDLRKKIKNLATLIGFKVIEEDK